MNPITQMSEPIASLRSAGIEPALKRGFRTRLKAVLCSLLVSIILLLSKTYIYHITQSAAVLSDALESIVNVAAAGFALTSVLLSAAPPDRSHPYGHGKIEFFSAGFEGLLIALAAAGIFWTSIPRILNPMDLLQLDEGLVFLTAASFLNLMLGVFLIRTGKKTKSLTLIADGRHVLTDVYTSGGVILGLLLVWLTGWYRLDGIVACVMGLNILYTGLGLIKKSFSGLMDESDEELLRHVSETIQKHRRENWIDIHQLRAVRSGNIANIDLHLILPRNLPLEEAHREAEEMEKRIVQQFEGRAVVLIHMDPCTDETCPVCQRHICRERSREHRECPTWEWHSLVEEGKET